MGKRLPPLQACSPRSLLTHSTPAMGRIGGKRRPLAAKQGSWDKRQGLDSEGGTCSRLSVPHLGSLPGASGWAEQPSDVPREIKAWRGTGLFGVTQQLGQRVGTQVTLLWGLGLPYLLRRDRDLPRPPGWVPTPWGRDSLVPRGALLAAGAGSLVPSSPAVWASAERASPSPGPRARAGVPPCCVFVEHVAQFRGSGCSCVCGKAGAGGGCRSGGKHAGGRLLPAPARASRQWV